MKQASLRTIAGAAMALLVAGLVSGCDVKTRLLLSSEDKINAAFPVSDAARDAKSAVDALPDDGVRRELEDEYAIRMRLRALDCAHGYTPSRLDSIDTTRKHFETGTCFGDADTATARWMGLRRVGLLLAKPPLRDVGKPPPYIVADDSIQSATIAAKAGVVLVQTNREVQVLPFDGLQPLFREARALNAAATISPNGRLFTTTDTGHLRIRETESGRVVADL
jgi:hypothetical protein